MVYISLMKKLLARFAPFITLVILLVACSFNEDFRQWGNIVNIAKHVSFSGLLALGMTIVIAGGGIDLSVGSLLAVSGVLSMQLMIFAEPSLGTGGAFVVMVLSAILIGILGGAINGALVNYGRIPPFIATLGTFSIFRSIAVYSADAGLIQSRNSILNSLSLFLNQTVPFLIFLLATIVLFILVKYHKFGWQICAVGANEKASVYSALNVKMLRLGSYVIIGLLAGISAILFSSRLNSISSTGAGYGYELDAIAAVIIGGTSMSGGKASVLGTFAGVLILGIIANVLDLWSISAHLQGTVKGAVIILAVLLQYKRS